MKCTNCLYEEDCNLKEIARDITGCDGHSKEKPPKEDCYKCSSCGIWTSKEMIFLHKDGKHHLCFDCY